MNRQKIMENNVIYYGFRPVYESSKDFNKLYDVDFSDINNYILTDTGKETVKYLLDEPTEKLTDDDVKEVINDTSTNITTLNGEIIDKAQIISQAATSVATITVALDNNTPVKIVEP